MYDLTISATNALAYVMWAAGFALVAVDVLGGARLGDLGILVACIGGILHIRLMLCRIHRDTRNAFELGREYGQSQGGQVRSIR